MQSRPMILGIAAIIRDCPRQNTQQKGLSKAMSLAGSRFEIRQSYTPFLPMYSAIWPLAIAPTIAPTLDREPNTEYYNTWNKRSKSDNGKKTNRDWFTIITSDTVKPRSLVIAACVGEE